MQRVEKSSRGSLSARRRGGASQQPAELRPTAVRRRRSRAIWAAAALLTLTAYTVAAVFVPGLQVAIASRELRIIVEVSGAFVAMFAALVLVVPDEEHIGAGGDAYVRDAYVAMALAAALLALNAAYAVFGVAPVLLLVGPDTSFAFHPWVAVRYVAGVLFVGAGLRRPRLRPLTLIGATLTLLAVLNAGLLLVAGHLPLPPPLALLENLRGVQVPVSPPLQTAALLAVPAALFSAGALLAGRLYRTGAGELYLWLALALGIEVLVTVHAVLYPGIAGPVVTSADLLRLLAFVVLLVGAGRKVQQLLRARGQAVEAQLADLRAHERLLGDLAAASEREAAFHSIVVHELATPVATLQAYAHVLNVSLDLAAQPPSRTALQGLRSESRRLQELIVRMDELRKLDLEELSIDLRQQSLAPLLEEAAAYARGLPGAHPVTVTARGVEAPVDATRLGQALRNVLNNAGRYSPPGSPVLLEARAVTGGRVELVIEDAGPGIPERDRDRMLQRSERGRPPAKAPGQGLGLGLYVARRIVEAHGGCLRIEEPSNKQGTRAVLELPEAGNQR